MAVKAKRVSQTRKGRRAMAAAKARGPQVIGELITKNGFANFMDGADRNELAVATLL